MELEVGQIYAARYRIARRLGEGAMGAVYEAEHLLIHRRVALKVLHAHVAEQKDALHRFEREAQAAGRIGSPHIVEVLDMGELPDNSRFLVMELLEGETLAQRVRGRGRLSPEEIVPIACQLLAGLGAAHAADIVHRDLKPANVFLVSGRGGGDFVKILDFGVSKFNALGDDMGATAPGTAIGTPHYMSPEQAKGSHKIDPRSDLYAVGVMLYECVTGQVPFDAATFNELIFRIVLEAPQPMEAFVPGVDPTFIAIVQQAMARELADRFQSARELHDALSGWLARATGRALAHGALPWDDAPASRRASGAATDAAFDHAPTLLREPGRRRPLGAVAFALGLLGVLVGGGVVLFAARAAPDKAAAASPAVTASPPAASAAPLPPTAELASSASAAPAPPPPPASASRPAVPRAKSERPLAAPSQRARTVPSEL